jgi:hypothetical protein
LVDGITFIQNLCLLLFLIIGGIVTLVLIIATWTGIKLAIFLHRRRVAEEELREKRTWTDEKPFLVDDQGICEGCGHVFNEIFVLRDARRLCAHCYRKLPPHERALYVRKDVKAVVEDATQSH